MRRKELPIRPVVHVLGAVMADQYYRFFPIQAGTNEDYIHPDQRWYVNTGTFRKSRGIGFVDYAELAGFSPLPLGYVVVEVRDRKIQAIREVEV